VLVTLIRCIFSMSRGRCGVVLTARLSVACVSTYLARSTVEPVLATLVPSFVSGLLANSVLVWELFKQMRQVVAGSVCKGRQPVQRS